MLQRSTKTNNGVNKRLGFLENKKISFAAVKSLNSELKIWVAFTVQKTSLF